MGLAAFADGCGTAARCPHTVDRAKLTRKVEGGWAHMLRRFLEHLLTHPCGLAAGGVHVALDDGPQMIYGRLTNVLADGDGHMQAWDWKGASALRCCVKHANVLKKVTSTTHWHDDRCGTAAA